MDFNAQTWIVQCAQETQEVKVKENNGGFQGARFALVAEHVFLHTANHRKGELSGMKRSKNLTLVAYGAIKEMMMNSHAFPEKRLKFRQLAEQIGVSRTTVNNALYILAKEGYLDFVPNQGYSVRSLNKKEIEDLQEIRLILEIGTVGKAIHRMTDESFLQFEKAKTAYEYAIVWGDYQKLYLLDAEFHASLIAMAGNYWLVQHYLEICRKAVVCLRSDALPAQRVWQIAREHNTLFEAVRIRDVDTVKDMIRKHTVYFRKDFLPFSAFPKIRRTKNLYHLNVVDHKNFRCLEIPREPAADINVSDAR